MPTLAEDFSSGNINHLDDLLTRFGKTVKTEVIDTGDPARIETFGNELNSGGLNIKTDFYVYDIYSAVTSGDVFQFNSGDTINLIYKIGSYYYFDSEAPYTEFTRIDFDLDSIYLNPTSDNILLTSQTHFESYVITSGTQSLLTKASKDGNLIGEYLDDKITELFELEFDAKLKIITS